jgi:hypothetical protein
MVKVETILLKIVTADVENADIDSGYVYLGIGGREYRIESDIEDEGTPGEDDFERGAEWTYILGKDPASVPPNNPPKIMTVHNKKEVGKNSILEHYPLDTDLLEGPQAETNYRFPIYIRLEGSDHWALAGAFCQVFFGTQNPLYYTTIFEPRDYIWLGPTTGKICYLRAYRPVDDRARRL